MVMVAMIRKEEGIIEKYTQPNQFEVLQDFNKSDDDCYDDNDGQVGNCRCGRWQKMLSFNDKHIFRLAIASGRKQLRKVGGDGNCFQGKSFKTIAAVITNTSIARRADTSFSSG